MEDRKEGQMKTTDIIKMIKADIDQDKRNLEALTIKLFNSCTLLEKIQNKKKEGESS